MYTMSPSEQSNFLSTDFMAVSTNASVSTNVVDGAIDIVKLKLLVQVVMTEHLLIFLLEVMVRWCCIGDVTSGAVTDW